MHRLLVILVVGFCCAIADGPAAAQEPPACGRNALSCWQDLYAPACALTGSTLETCLVFLQRVETARRGSSSADLALLLGETLHGLAQRDLPLEVKTRYLERSRTAYREVVRRQPLSAAGYLGLAKAADTGEERVEWLRGAVEAELKPADMELLARTVSTDLGGHVGNSEASRLFEHAYTLESTGVEKWRYGATAWQWYRETLVRYPSTAGERSVENLVTRIHDDIDYPLLQRMLRNPESYLAFIGDAFATMCEKSIAEVITLDECMAGLESAVTSAEGSRSFGDRRVLAEAALTGMRTIAGESLPRSLEARGRFLEWIERLLMTRLEPVDVAADLLEAQADYTASLLDRADALATAIELSPNRADLRMKLGATYVSLRNWGEAVEQLRVARYLVPPEEQERANQLFETADQRFQARFSPPPVSE